MIDMDRLAESHYSRIDPEFDDSELEESPAFDDEEWTQIVEDAWQVTQAINKTMEYADAIGDKILMKQVSILSKRFTNMKGDMQL